MGIISLKKVKMLNTVSAVIKSESLKGELDAIQRWKNYSFIC
jgi:hypothetical protein